MPRTIQPSFAKGEISPELHGRVDVGAYAISLQTARNAIVHTYGGISKRPGFRYIGPVADHSYAPHLIPFEFKTTDTYILEFGDKYMRVIRDNGHVLETAVNISGITQADPAVVTANSHGFSDGDEVYISGVSGMTEVNQNRYYITNTTTHTFELTNQITGTDIDSTGFTAYTSGGTVQRIYEITTPYDKDDLHGSGGLKFVQSADVMTLVHKNYDIRELRRNDHDDWELVVLDMGPEIDHPAGLSVTVNTTGSETRFYKVTAIDRETQEESLPAVNNTVKTITGATKADPVVITANSHGFSDGDEVEINSVGGMTELNGNRYIVANKTSNTFELTDADGANIDGTGFTTYTSGGAVAQTFAKVTNSNVTEDNTISWTSVSGADRYAIYRKDSTGVYGLIGESETTSFLDSNIAPDSTIGPPSFRQPFSDAGDQPGAVGFYEQRRVFGGSLNEPDTSKFSQIASFDNFNKSTPIQEDDAFDATLTSTQVNEIRHYVPLGDLIVFTSGSEWRVNAGPDSRFGPETIHQKPQSEFGASRVPPYVVGNSVIFVSADQSTIRSLGYSLEKDAYVPANLNILSDHLMRGREVEDWALTRFPENRFHIVTNCGCMRTLSFDQEQEVVAWTRWDTSGTFEDVAALRQAGPAEGLTDGREHNTDTLYCVIKRQVNGNTVRYIEYTNQRSFDNIRDCFFVDSGLSLDNPIDISDVSEADPVVITASSHGLENGDEIDIEDIEWDPTTDSYGDEVQPDQLNGGRYKVANKTANTFELQTTEGVDVDGSAFKAYYQGGQVRKAVDSVSGLDHLEGRKVIALCDGNVVSNKTVSNGSISFDTKYSKIHAGLRYVFDIQTLPLEVGQGTIQGLPKSVSEVTIRFYKSRGIFVGYDEDHLEEMKQREFEALGEPTNLLTGDKTVVIDPSWNKQGQIWIKNPYPLPTTVLAIIPEFQVGDDDE